MTPSKTHLSQTVRAHKIHFYRQIAFTFIGAALVVLIGILYFSLSQATIYVTPSLETVKADFNVLVKKGETITDQGISATVKTQNVTVSRTDMGELLEDGEPQQASGTVILENSSNREQPLVATTRLLSEEGVLFRLQDAVTVPAKGEVSARVYADKKGKDGEVAPTRFTIPGLNQARQQEVFAHSEESMTGGTSAIYRVTKESVDKALVALKEKAIQQAKDQLKDEDVNLDDLLNDAVSVEITKQEVDPAEGEDAKEFDSAITADVTFIFANREDLLQLAQSKLFSSVSLGYELSSSNEGSLTYSIAHTDLEKGTAQLRVVLEGQKRISSDHPLLDKASFVAKKPADVKSILEADSGVKEVRIQLRPFWLRRIPRLVDHIFVQFQ